MQNGYLTQTTEKRLMIVSGQGYPALAEDGRAARRGAEQGGADRVPQRRAVRPLPGERPWCGYVHRAVSVRSVNKNLMQLLVMIDAATRASAKRIVAVIPWYAYSRQDRKTKPREPITARLVANMIQAAGAERVMTMDLHSGQIEGYFTFPVDHLTAMHTFVDYFVEGGFRDADDAVVVAPDTGEVKVAAARRTPPAAMGHREQDALQAGRVRGNARHRRGRGQAGHHDRRRDRYRRDPDQRRGASGGRRRDGGLRGGHHGEFSGKAYRRIEDSLIREVVVTDASLEGRRAAF